MKKLAFLFSIVAMLAVTAAKAQGIISPNAATSFVGYFQSDDTTHAKGLDTTANSASISQILQLPGYWDYVTIQTGVTKLTGNPTLGSVKLQGSVDGVKWDWVTTATDTLAVTNVSTVQVHTWKLTGNPFAYYKAICKGGNGATQTSTVNTVVLYRRK
jgi:hypothetical protein